MASPAVDRREANLQVLNDASKIQSDTKESIWRTQKMAAEAEALGTQTLEELRRQGQQMNDIESELVGVESKLEQSKRLQTKFDVWAGNWLGGKKRSAMKEAAAEIAQRNLEEHSKIKECFQHEKFESLSRTWKSAGLVLCSDPSVTCSDLFDPAIQESIENSHWTIDFSLAGIDAEGWTYSFDFATLNRTGAGDSAPKWNSYVRRRKWKFADKNAGGSVAMNEIKDRNEARKAKQGTSSRSADKIGYTARAKPSTLTASGLTSGGMLGKGKNADQQLDDESAAGLARLEATDAEIDQGIDAIGNSIDNLGRIAAAMNEETKSQNTKLDKIDAKMNTVGQSATVVNARQRYLLK